MEVKKKKYLTKSTIIVGSISIFILALIGLLVGLYFRNTIIYSFNLGYDNVVLKQRASIAPQIAIVTDTNL